MSALGSSAESPNFRCALCGAEERRSVPAPAIVCPRCGRPVADVSGVLMRMPLPANTVELLPESVARENRVMIFADEPHELVVAIDFRRMPTATGLDMLDKLRFILNREARAVHATQEAIQFAIDRDYGRDDDSGGESTIFEL